MHEFDGRQRDRLARDIAERLHAVCAHLSAAQFEALVDDLVAMKARFKKIDRDPSLWHPVACGYGDAVADRAAVRRADVEIRVAKRTGPPDD